MDEMEREALRRAEKMRGAFYSDRNVHKESSKPKPKETTTDENKSSEKLKDKKVNIPKQSQNKPKEKQGDILEADRLRAEKQKELNDLTMQEFENIDETYSMKIGHTDNKVKAFQDQILI